MILFSWSVAISKRMTDNGEPCGIQLCKGIYRLNNFIDFSPYFPFCQKSVFKIDYFWTKFPFFSLHYIRVNAHTITCFFKINGFCWKKWKKAFKATTNNTVNNLMNDIRKKLRTKCILKTKDIFVSQVLLLRFSISCFILF